MLELPSATILAASYAACAVAYFVLFLLILFSRTRTLYRNLMLLACAVTALWATAFLAWPLWGWSPVLALALELARDAAWLAFATSLLTSRQIGSLAPRRWTLSAAVAAILVLGAAVELAHQIGQTEEGVVVALVRTGGVLRIILAIVMLLILENLYRNADPDGRWSLKYLCIALGFVFAYEFLMYADFVLFLRLDPAMLQARGFVNALAVLPLAASITRAKGWQIDIQVSRNAVFHSFVLIASGAYLVVMAAAGFFLREFGGEWGDILQIFLISAALIVLGVLFTSGSARSRVRVFISKNFYSHKYDYRVEWLRFIQAMSASDDVENALPLQDRVLRAVTEVVDSPAGGLWVRREQDGAYICTASWAFGEVLPAIRIDHPLVRFLEDNDWIVLISEFQSGAGTYDGLELPEWLADHSRAWMIVPLIHRHTLRALLVLDAPRVHQALTWEDFDLLKTIGRQAAGYLAEEHAHEVLSDTRKLEAFNQRFAFVVHDIKNLVSQMSLMLKNAEHHGDNPEFQKDMLETVGNSIVRMKAMLEQLNTEKQRDLEAARGREPVRAVVQSIADSWRQQIPDLQVEVGSDGGAVVSDGGRLATVLDHLLQNAVEATGEDGRISLKLRANDREAVIEVEDNGPGMDPKFVRDRLFSPFDTSKPSGFGLGAYQTRQMVRELGGRLEVNSEPGRGTIMRIVLPSVEPSWADDNPKAKAV